MSRNASYYLKTGSLLLLILIIVGYTFYQARGLIFGPSITLSSPIPGETYTNPVVDVKGVATNATYFAIDDNPVLLDTDGSFDEQLLLADGYNIIKVDARDKFGKTKELLLQIILQNSQPMTVTTSTQATSTTQQ